MSTTPNLLINLIASNAAAKEVTANSAFVSLDGALCSNTSVALPDADYTFAVGGGSVGLVNIAFTFTGTLTAARNVTLPPNAKMYIVKNATSNTLTFKVGTGANTVTVGDALYHFLYSDGANGVWSVAGSGGSGGTFVYVGVLSGLPATATVGQLAFVTDATAGSNIYECTATNVWTQSSATFPVTTVFGRAGAVTAQSGDYSVAQVTGAAPLASPALTGTPTAPTPTTADNSTKIATTAYVQANVLTGPTGPMGPTGSTGATGPTGPTGPSGPSTFDAVGTGTNTTATMTVGTGAALVPSGTGVINATQVNGIPITGSLSHAGQIPISQPGNASAVWADPLVQGIQAEGTSASTVNPVLIAGKDGSGNLKDLILDSSGRATVNVNGTVPVSGTFWQATQPVSVASLPSVAVTNAGTFATQSTLAAETTKVIGTVRAVGNAGGVYDALSSQNVTAPTSMILTGGEFNTTPTTIVSGNASPLQLDSAGNLLVNVKSNAATSVTQGTSPWVVSGAVTVASTTITGSVAVTGTFWQTTQPVSIASLPSVAVTNTGTFAVQAGVPALGQAVAASSLPVVLTAAQLTTLTPPSAITGFALEAGNLATLVTRTPVLGQALAAASVPVVLTAAQMTTLTPLSTVAVSAVTTLPAITVAAGQTIAVTNAGTFAVQATLAAATWSHAIIAISAATGTQTLITGVAAQVIKIMKIQFTTSAATNFNFLDSTPTTLSGTYVLNATGSAFADFGNSQVLWTGASGKGFQINLSGTVTLGGDVWYTQA